MTSHFADVLAIVGWLAWCGALGACFMSLFWPRRVMPHRPWLWLAALSLAAGLAISSISHLLWIVTAFANNTPGETAPAPWTMDAALSAMLVVAAAISWYMRRIRRNRAEESRVTLAAAIDDGAVWWRGAACLSVAAMLAGALVRLRESPHGEFDAISIWNVRARFFFRAPDHWRDAFATAVHADYPLMLPLNVARSWHAAGQETLVAPAILSLLFSLMLIAAVWGPAKLLVGPNRAALAILMLTAIPLLSVQASFEYADVPVACCVASATGLAMLSLRLQGTSENDGANSAHALGLLALSGLCCGAAAWLKNEGQLITLCAAVATLLVHPAGLSQSFRARFIRLAAFVSGAALPLLVVIAVRKSIGHRSDLMGERSLETILSLLFDPSRHARILSEFFLRVGDVRDDQIRQGLSSIAPAMLVNLSGLLLACAAVALTWPRPRKPGWLAPASRWPLIFVTLFASGYYVVYLLTPYDIEWHVKYSITRLFMHLWPAIVLCAATAGPLIEKHEASKS